MKDTPLKYVALALLALVVAGGFYMKKETKVIALSVLNKGTSDERKELLYMKGDEMFHCLIFIDNTMKCESMGEIDETE